jgi:hypothetical protein
MVDALLGFLSMLAITARSSPPPFHGAPHADGWKLKRRTKISLLVAMGLVLTYALVGMVG